MPKTIILNVKDALYELNYERSFHIQDCAIMYPDPDLQADYPVIVDYKANKKFLVTNVGWETLKAMFTE